MRQPRRRPRERARDGILSEARKRIQERTGEWGVRCSIKFGQDQRFVNPFACERGVEVEAKSTKRTVVTTERLQHAVKVGEGALVRHGWRRCLTPRTKVLDERLCLR